MNASVENELAAKGLVVKAFVDHKPVEQPMEDWETAVKLFEQYKETPYCDAAYIFVGDRIAQAWSDPYDAHLASLEEDDEDDDDLYYGSLDEGERFLEEDENDEEDDESEVQS